MSLERDVRHGVRIARAEFVRSVRALVGNRRRVVGLGFAVLFFGGQLLFALPTAYVAGRTVGSVAGIPFFASAATAVPVALLLFSLFRTLERAGGVEAEDALLLTVHPRAVVVGLIGAEIARSAVWFGLPLGAFLAAFVLGLGAPSLLVTGGLVALPLVCWAAVWGYACGIGVLRVLRRLPSLRRLLKAGWLVGVLGLVVASQFIGQHLAEGSISGRAILSALTVAPLADYVALAFVGTPLARPTSVYALGVLAALVALTPVGLVVATRQATGLWFADAPNRGGERRAKTSTGGFTAPRPFAWTRAGRIAWGFLVRSARHPQELSHLVMILFFIGPVATGVTTAGDALGPLAAGVGVGLGTYVAGAAFGLNPLGDDRPQLPLLLLTATEPRTIVQGRLLAGLALGVPIAVLVPLASVGVGTAPLTGVAFGAVGIATCLVAAHFAVGLGSAYPVYEEREFWGSKTVVPSTLVMMVYVFVAGGGTVLALLGTWYALAGHLVRSLALGAGLGAFFLVAVGTSYGSYRYAIRRYRRNALD